MPVPIPRHWALGLAVVVAGCEPLAREDLAVATTWPAADRARIAEAFNAWLREHPDAPGPRPLRIRWLMLTPGDDMGGLADRRNPPDVILGGPARTYERLARSQRLAPLPIEGSPPWALSRKAMIGTVSTSREARATHERDSSTVAFDDPRKDPISLAWADVQLGRESFVAHYARLVRDAGNPRRIGRQAGAASAAAERGETERAVGVTAVEHRLGSPIPWSEGVAIPAGGRHRVLATAFLQFLAETGNASPVPVGLRPASSDDLDLLADLLGATLVDAQDELWAAWDALEAKGSPESQLRWMTEPPPWPPASIARILDRQGEQAMAMVESLAGQLTTDAEARAWLISTWLSPTRPIDRQVLGEITHAAGGRLFREPRFREWLRAEWTAWARQRYRRVLRSLTGQGGRAP